jgi:hypothetical protein
MYKITDNIQLIHELNANAAQFEGNSEVKYCEVNKHAMQELYAIPIIVTYLSALGYTPEFWADAVQELPASWTWHYQTHQIRLNVNKKLLTIDMRESNDIADLVNYALNDANIKQHIIDTAEADRLYIYLTFILPEHEIIIAASDTITIEYNENPT